MGSSSSSSSQQQKRSQKQQKSLQQPLLPSSKQDKPPQPQQQPQQPQQPQQEQPKPTPSTKPPQQEEEEEPEDGEDEEEEEEEPEDGEDEDEEKYIYIKHVGFYVWIQGEMAARVAAPYLTGAATNHKSGRSHRDSAKQSRGGFTDASFCAKGWFEKLDFSQPVFVLLVGERNFDGASFYRRFPLKRKPTEVTYSYLLNAHHVIAFYVKAQKLKDTRGLHFAIIKSDLMPMLPCITAKLNKNYVIVEHTHEVGEAVVERIYELATTAADGMARPDPNAVA